jgi:hypothetical protein
MGKDSLHMSGDISGGGESPGLVIEAMDPAQGDIMGGGPVRNIGAPACSDDIRIGNANWVPGEWPTGKPFAGITPAGSPAEPANIQDKNNY